MPKRTGFAGMDELREWLTAQGFTCSKNWGSVWGNTCNWYAYRRSELSARACESNADKPGMQIVVMPYQTEASNGAVHQAVEIELCGNVDGTWWKMMAYSLKPEEVQEKLADIERALIAAWNALRPRKEVNHEQC